MQKNLFILSGTLAKSELRYTQEQKAVCHFYLSQVDKSGNQQSLVCRADNELAEKIGKLKEGETTLTVFGRMETKKYRGANGAAVPFTEIVVTEAYAVGECINKVLLAGRFSQEPQYYTATENKKSLLRNSIAVTTGKGADNEQTEFVSCTFFDRVADFVSKYFNKGNAIWVEGKLLLEAYNDKDGNQRVGWKVNVNRADFLERKQQNVTAPATPDLPPMPPAQASAPAPAPAPASQQVKPTADGFTPIPPGGGWGNLPM